MLKRIMIKAFNRILWNKSSIKVINITPPHKYHANNVNLYSSYCNTSDQAVIIRNIIRSITDNTVNIYTIVCSNIIYIVNCCNYYHSISKYIAFIYNYYRNAVIACAYYYNMPCYTTDVIEINRTPCFNFSRLCPDNSYQNKPINQRGDLL